MSLNEEVELLRNIPMFANIEPSKLKLLAFTSERMTFKAGDALFSQGEPGDSAYVIIDGEADVLVDTPKGPLTVAKLKRNDIVGEIAILCDVPRTATVQAAMQARGHGHRQGSVLPPGDGIPADGGRDHARAGAPARRHQPQAHREKRLSWHRRRQRAGALRWRGCWRSAPISPRPHR